MFHVKHWDVSILVIENLWFLEYLTSPDFIYGWFFEIYCNYYLLIIPISRYEGLLRYEFGFQWFPCSKIIYCFT